MPQCQLLQEILDPMKLSIIIPAYNADAYIETCLLSCCLQELQPSDYEVIVVNDGSTDHTAEKVESFSKQYLNIQLVSQLNKGNGAARNTGVKHAKGTYIYFLDADDYIAKNTLGKLINLAEHYKLDFLGFDSINVTDSLIANSRHNQKEITMGPVLNGIDFIGTYNYQAEVWWYITRRQFYFESGTHFYDRKFVQDSYLTPTLISKAQRAAFAKYDVHRYRQSTSSITRNKSIEHLNRHFGDLTFSVKKLYELRKSLIRQGVTNDLALQRLHVKQQRYVFITIVRFIRTSLEVSRLEGMLSEYDKMEAYPLDVFMSSTDYRTPFYRFLTFLFNRKYLLFPCIKMYRLLT